MQRLVATKKNVDYLNNLNAVLGGYSNDTPRYLQPNGRQLRRAYQRAQKRFAKKGLTDLFINEFMLQSLEVK